MPSDLFKAIDKRYLIEAYVENSTHSTQEVFETGLDFTPNTANKTTRASGTISHIFKQPNTDELVIALLNYLFVENPYSVRNLENNTSFKALKKNVLDKRGIAMTDDGFILPEATATPAGGAGPHSTPSPVSTPSPSAGGTVSSVAEPIANRKTVFVVHGRDTRPVHVLETFLGFLGIGVMSWSGAIDHTGETQPHTYDIVKAGMDNAAAIIVIFSPDDEATVKREFAEPGDSETPEGQARQNVLVEAGMAFAVSREKTIFVQSGWTRPISDLEGFNWVKLNGRWDSRQDLINRLQRAGADAIPMHSDLAHRIAGPFEVKA